MRLALVVFGYLCGSVPWGLVLARRAGVDVRRSGSGNIGAANVARTAGAALGGATLLADALKGAVPVLVAGALTDDPRIPAAAGLAAFLGHVFAGGKGVATALGVLAVLCPAAVAVALGIFALVFALARYVSLASMVAALVTPVSTGLLGCPGHTVAAGAVMAGVIVLRHRENLARLRAGTEPPFTLHK